MKNKKLNIALLVGLTIDTNAHKFEPVKKGEEQEAHDTLVRYCGLKQLRRIKGTNTFTAYYSPGQGETLEEFLSK